MVGKELAKNVKRIYAVLISKGVTHPGTTDPRRKSQTRGGVRLSCTLKSHQKDVTTFASLTGLGAASKTDSGLLGSTGWEQQGPRLKGRIHTSLGGQMQGTRVPPTGHVSRPEEADVTQGLVMEEHNGWVAADLRCVSELML